MTPSLEIRNEAARLHDLAWSYDDKIVKAEDRGASDEQIEALDQECFKAWRSFYDFCDAHRFELLTEASGTVLRCSESNAPLVDTDDCLETYDGKLVMVEREVA